MSISDLIKRFAISNQLLEHALDQVEAEHAVDLSRGHSSTLGHDESYYPQIESAIRAEAARMAPHYEVFYSLERSIRNLVRSTLEGVHGDGWWDKTNLPGTIDTDVADRRKRELDTGITPRSSDEIDFTTFGELGEIIKANWDVFGALFRSPKAVERVMSSLNTLRGPIAHCSPLAEDEVVRLRLTVRDWFRLME